jgi:hypothetical protein
MMRARLGPTASGLAMRADDLNTKRLTISVNTRSIYDFA